MPEISHSETPRTELYARKSEIKTVSQTLSCSKTLQRASLRLIAPSKSACSIFVMVHILLSHPGCVKARLPSIYECLLKLSFTYTCLTSDAHEARRPSALMHIPVLRKPVFCGHVSATR